LHAHTEDYKLKTSNSIPLALSSINLLIQWVFLHMGKATAS